MNMDIDIDMDKTEINAIYVIFHKELEHCIFTLKRCRVESLMEEMMEKYKDTKLKDWNYRIILKEHVFDADMR